MKYLLKYKLFENVERRNLYDILKSVDSDDDIYEINKVFNLDKNECYLSEDDIDLNNLKFYTNLRYLSDIMDIDEGILDDMDRLFCAYSDFEYYLDKQDEMENISLYINSHSIELVSKIAKYFNYELKLDKDVYEQKIVDFLKYIGLYDEISYQYLSDLSYLKEKSLQDYIEERVLSKQPFSVNVDINYGDENKKKYTYSIYLNYDKIIKFLEDNNIKNDVYNFGDFFHKISDFIPYKNYYEYETYEYESSDNMKKISENFIDIIEIYWDEEENEIDQKLYFKLVEIDNIEEIKKHIGDIYWINKDYMTGKYIIEFAKKNSKCYEFFASNDFLDMMKERYDDIDADFIEVLSQMNDERFGEEIGLF